MPDPGAAQPATGLAGLLAAAWEQAAAACARNGELRQWTTQMLAETGAARRISAEARRRRRSSPAGRDLMQRSEHARLLARLECMPVIEQAKGIIMAQSHCGHAQAFDVLRRASQRSNIPVRELAAQIVAKVAQVSPGALSARPVNAARIR
jgi:ANTAR domain